MERSEWILVVLDAAAKPVEPAQFQKVLFLLGESFPQVKRGDYYRFAAYNYGAFDAHVYADTEAQVFAGNAVASRRLGRSWSEYEITPAGRARAAQLQRELPQGVGEYLRALVAWAQSLDFDQLVKAVYDLHPWTKANSVFQG